MSANCSTYARRHTHTHTQSIS